MCTVNNDVTAFILLCEIVIVWDMCLMYRALNGKHNIKQLWLVSYLSVAGVPVLDPPLSSMNETVSVTTVEEFPSLRVRFPCCC